MNSTFAKIAAAKDFSATEVNVPEWGVTVYVRPMTVAERERLESALSEGDAKNSKGLRSLLLTSCCYDDRGDKVFSTDEQVKVIDGKNSVVVDRLVKAIRKANGMTADAVDAAKKD